MRLRGKYRVPEGTYIAEFVGIKEIETEAYGAGLAWQFVIVGKGECEGKEISRVTGPNPSTKNACGELLAAVCGARRYTSTLDDKDTDDYIGRRYEIEVAESQSGATRVEEATLLDVPIPEPPRRPGAAAVKLVGAQHAGSEIVGSPPQDEVPF